MNFIGKGLYTISDIHILTGISLAKISRWTNGYTYYRKGLKHSIPSIYHNDFQQINSKKILSFLDLIELLFIASFEKYGLSLQSIRKSAECASKLFNTTHPFAKKSFYTDGKSILAKIVEHDENPELLDLLKHQYQLEPIVSPFLYESLDFDNFDMAEKWWPLGKEHRIVVDPKRSFGKLIIDNLNIRVDTIIDIYERNKNIEEIMDWYEIDEDTIMSALEFQNRKIA